MTDKITPEQQDEARARAIYDLFVYDEPTGTKPPWVVGGNSLKQDEARRMARAIREADAALGVVSVPKEATGEMIGAGGVKMFEADMAAAKPREATEAIINAAIRAGAIGCDDEKSMVEKQISDRR